MHVVVVGGGIVGVASAYELARTGADVTLVERDSLGAGSTDRALGGIRAQFSTAVNVALSVASQRVWDSFTDRFGVDIERRQTGYLFVTREEETGKELQRQVDLQAEYGVPSRLVTPAEAGEISPGLRSESFVAGTYSPEDSFADPHLAVQGFGGAARDAGARIETGTTVIDIHRKQSTEPDGPLADGGSGATDGTDTTTDDPNDTGGVVVETDDGSLVADWVVNAAGAWAPRLAELAGYELPIEPHRRQIAVVDPERPVPEDDPLTIDLDTTAHFRPERDGRAVVGGHFGDEPPVVDPDDFSETPDLDWQVEAVERAGDLAEYFGPDSRIAGGWAGLYAVTPDHHPVIERSVPGVVTAAGFSGHGFQHAPATAQIVAELVTEGVSRTVDVSGLSRDRFERGEAIDERNVA